MPKRRFSDEQITFGLRLAEAGTTVGEMCRKMGIAEATFYRWKKVYAGMGVAEIRRLGLHELTLNPAVFFSWVGLPEKMPDDR